MARRAPLIAAVAVAAACGARWAGPRLGGLVPFESRAAVVTRDVRVFTLDNGLRVALVPDARTNLATIDLRFAVGHADDPPGRSGMAHLVEHLWFEGRAGDDGRTFGDELGEHALHHNAYTRTEETHYTETALAEHLDKLLDLEARRMSQPCDALAPELLARERDVVLAEALQRGGSRDRDEVDVAMWGEDHPYARALAHDQIAAVTADEVCAFRTQHYAPGRAILVVAGGFDAGAVERRVRERFGGLAAATASAARPAIAPMRGGEHELRGDHVGVYLHVAWPAPAEGSDEEIVDEVAQWLFARAVERAIADEQWLLDAETGAIGARSQPATSLTMWLLADDRAKAVPLVDRLVERLGTAIDPVELAEARAAVRAAHALAWDDFTDRGEWVADRLQSGDGPTLDDPLLARLDHLTAADVQRRAATAFAGAARTIVWNVGKDPDDPDDEEEEAEAASPQPAAAAAATHDVDVWAPEVDPAEASRPLAIEVPDPAPTERFTLANGLRVILAPDPTSPILDARLIFPVGSDLDDLARPGLAALTAASVDDDHDVIARDRTVRWALGVDTWLGATAGPRTTTFRALGSATWADWHVWRLWWRLDGGGLGNLEEVQRKTRWQWAYFEEMSHFVMRQKLFGSAHAYAMPGATPNVLRHHRREHVAELRARWYRAHGATLIVAGGFDAAAMRREIEALFGAWSADPAPTLRSPGPPHPVRGPSWIVVDAERPAQGHITFAFAVRSDQRRDAAGRLVLAEVLQRRLRLVREQLGVSYGVRVSYGSGTMADVLEIDAAVREDRTAEIVRLVLDELAALRDRPDDGAAEVVRARRRVVAGALARSSGTIDLAAALHEGALASAEGGDPRPALARAAAAVTLDDVAKISDRDLDPARMVVVVQASKASVDATLAASAGDAHVDRYVDK